MPNQPNPRIRIEALRRRIARLEQSRRDGDAVPVRSGCGPLDRFLPERGFRRGTLIEWLAAGQGSGAGTLALAAAREACRSGGAVVVLDRAGEFYPPAAARLGIKLEDLIVVHAASEADHAWALDQAVRCPGAAAVLAWPEKLDGRTFRRLQLAAEESGCLGLLIRPASVRHEPSWAHVRLLVEPRVAKVCSDPTDRVELRKDSERPHECGHYERLVNHAGLRRLRIHLLRCRGGAVGRSIDVEVDDETFSVHLVARLADPTAGRRVVRA